MALAIHLTSEYSAYLMPDDTRLMRFNAEAEDAPGKTLLVVDTLSWSPAVSTMESSMEDACCYVNSIINSLVSSRWKLDEITTATQ